MPRSRRGFGWRNLARRAAVHPRAAVPRHKFWNSGPMAEPIHDHGGENVRMSEDAEQVLEILWIQCVERDKDSVDAGDMTHEDHTILTGTFDELAGKGLIEWKGTGESTAGRGDMICLTGRGKGAARSVVRRHRLAERLFHDVLNMRGEDMEGPACKLEHVLTPESEESICTLLGHPPECPHGRPIPEGRCCIEGRRQAGRLIFTVNELKKGQGGRISFLNTRNEGRLQKLIAMGILPGMDVEVIAHYPTHVLKIGESQFALDEDMASNIYVRVTEV